MKAGRGQWIYRGTQATVLALYIRWLTAWYLAGSELQILGAYGLEACPNNEWRCQTAASSRGASRSGPMIGWSRGEAECIYCISCISCIRAPWDRRQSAVSTFFSTHPPPTCQARGFSPSCVSCSSPKRHWRNAGCMMHATLNPSASLVGVERFGCECEPRFMILTSPHPASSRCAGGFGPPCTACSATSPSTLVRPAMTPSWVTADYSRHVFDCRERVHSIGLK